jgi:hypothetical protein
VPGPANAPEVLKSSTKLRRASPNAFSKSEKTIEDWMQQLENPEQGLNDEFKQQLLDSLAKRGKQ